MDEQKARRIIDAARANYKLAKYSIDSQDNVEAMAYLVEVLCGLMPIVYIKDINDIPKEHYDLACKMFKEARTLKKDIAFILKEENGKRI